MELKMHFWKKDTGNMMSHTKGLTKEQVEMFKELKEGDRLILHKNDKLGETSPDVTLKVFNAKPKV